MRKSLWVFSVLLAIAGFVASIEALNRDAGPKVSDSVLMENDTIKERGGETRVLKQGTGHLKSSKDRAMYIPPIVVKPSIEYAVQEGVCSLEEMGGVNFYSGIERSGEIKVIGESLQGRDLIAEHWGVYSGEQILVIGQTHGDECSGGVLVNAIRRNPPVSWGVWVIASINPDGAIVGERRNAGGIDLNRDGYDQRAPETKALLDFIRSVRPRYTIHLHSPFGWVGPWGKEGSKNLAAAIAANSGLRLNGWAGSGRGYLWEGGDAVFPGAESVLVEFPSLSSRESSAALNRGDGYVAEKKLIEQMADGVLAGLREFLGP